ncbi:MAG TPA: tRNA pseudouridine(13) synthase TruD, partial [Euryarchaeota archaeon]|nr:tRNA pseudouridine(13) synthase TruD [Euryarchaeota archaeon]
MISPFELDRLLGLNYFISNTPGVKGKLRQVVDDFSVDEVFEDSRQDDEGEYLHLIMEKRNWDTMRAVGNISRALHISRKRFGYAGTKDKRAVTKQRMSVWNIEKENLGVLNLKDIKLYNFIRSDERVNLGDLLGNKFKITIRKTEGDISHIKEVMQETVSQLSLGGVPNYFGYQRFGTVRPNTHLVGKKIIQGDLDGAVMQYLARPYPGEREDARDARETLSETGDFKKALEVYPGRLNYERNMLDALVKNPRDFAGALRRLPKKLRKMLVHACQSHIFNEVLSGAIAEGINIRNENIKLLGYKSGFSQDEIGRIEKEVLEREG